MVIFEFTRNFKHQKNGDGLRPVENYNPWYPVLYTAYLLVRSMLQKQLDQDYLQIKHKNQEVVLPIRLQAYERICLLLERIKPNNMVPRLNTKETTATELRVALINEIRNEFNHNLSQQVYMSSDAWMYVSSAIEQLISMINEAGNELEEGASGLQLARKIFDKSMENEQDTVQGALTFVKKEIQDLF